MHLSLHVGDAEVQRLGDQSAIGTACSPFVWNTGSTSSSEISVPSGAQSVRATLMMFPG